LGAEKPLRIACHALCTPGLLGGGMSSSAPQSHSEGSGVSPPPWPPPPWPPPPALLPPGPSNAGRPPWLSERRPLDGVFPSPPGISSRPGSSLTDRYAAVAVGPDGCRVRPSIADRYMASSCRRSLRRSYPHMRSLRRSSSRWACCSARRSI
jgi:hypothetical protein